MVLEGFLEEKALREWGDLWNKEVFTAQEESEEHSSKSEQCSQRLKDMKKREKCKGKRQTAPDRTESTSWEWQGMKLRGAATWL